MDGEKLSDLVTGENYGDYVDYPVDLRTTLLNGKSEDKNLDYDWRIFYKDPKSGRIFIIADDYVPNTSARLETAAGTNAKMTNNTSSEYNKYCWYWDMDSVPTYQTIQPTSPDMEELFWLRKWKVSAHQSVNNSKCVSTLLNTKNWEGFLDPGGLCGEYAVGGPTVEMWCNSWNDAHASSKIYTNKGASESYPGYYVGKSEPATSYSYTPSGISEARDRLWYPHYNNYSTFDGSNQCIGYWLASPTAFTSDGLMRVYYNGPMYYSNYNGSSVGLRPVVSLKSDVSATKGDDGVWQLQ